ncbi:MAG: phosphoribosylformylglycinamidine synthase subunit PurQ [Candidatus Muirbacterium halophilum]|nr:phosphoribosylformylglycinamidine synthase subunit PurQ [Candidatus Muirbacterium halophilum]MCK9474928.1 phosphoribosylformylglycinamidine synthase subunit PurQ [Candidatus Muirbacterium halophilum]
MKAGVIRFAGSNCDFDAYNVLKDVFKFKTDFLWHKENIKEKYDIIILPGGFSYGDYLRPGAIARFSKVMEDVQKHLLQGRLIIGICNGFQILCEAQMLPGVLMRNKNMKFICSKQNLKVENSELSKKIGKNIINMPIAHADGNYFADNNVLEKLSEQNRIILKYSDQNGNTDRIYNPNGSSNNIAGIMNESKNVFGTMPHPERACDDFNSINDGKLFLESIFELYGRF